MYLHHIAGHFGNDVGYLARAIWPVWLWARARSGPVGPCTSGLSVKTLSFSSQTWTHLFARFCVVQKTLISLINPAVSTRLRRSGVKWSHKPSRLPAAATLYTWAENFESFERINSIRETNGNHVNGWGTSRLHELYESKFPFVSGIEFIRSKLSNFPAHVYGVGGSYNRRPEHPISAGGRRGFCFVATSRIICMASGPRGDQRPAARETRH